MHSHPELRRQLDQDLRNASEIKRLRDSQGTRQLPDNFSAGIIAEAQRRARAAGLPSPHHVLRGPQVVSTAAPTTRRVPARVLTSIAALAGMLLLAIYIPKWPGSDALENSPLAIKPDTATPDTPPQKQPPQIQPPQIQPLRTPVQRICSRSQPRRLTNRRRCSTWVMRTSESPIRWWLIWRFPAKPWPKTILRRFLRTVELHSSRRWWLPRNSRNPWPMRG